jgi:hypothetical protein
MTDPTGEAGPRALRLDFDRRPVLQFRGPGDDTSNIYPAWRKGGLGTFLDPHSRDGAVFCGKILPIYRVTCEFDEIE